MIKMNCSNDHEYKMMCFTNNHGHDTLLAREQLTKLTVCSIMSRSLCLLYNHLMSYSKVLMTVVNFETQDHTQRDVAISTVLLGFYAHLFTMLTVRATHLAATSWLLFTSCGQRRLGKLSGSESFVTNS